MSVDVARPLVPSALVVHPDPHRRDALARAVGARGFQPLVAADPRLAVAAADAPGTSLVVLWLPSERSGRDAALALLDRMRRRDGPTPPVLLLGRGDSLELAEAGLARGATDVLVEPVDDDAVAVIASRAVERRELEDRLARHARRGSSLARRRGLLGRSAAMRAVHQRVERAARSTATVLIQGESGTGKELVARAIHAESRRAADPLVVLQCATIPTSLAASELFGHERGAFTDARSARRGRFELAHGGTLFLDEVGDLPPLVQVQLLRAIQFGEVSRVGSEQTRSVDVRIVAATHRPLEDMVRDGTFREDLYWRLNQFPIVVPPLRERGDDVLELARALLWQANRIEGRAVPGFTPEADAALAAHAWRGNVRELEHRVRRAVLESAWDRPLEPHHLGLGAPSVERVAESRDAAALESTLDDVEASIIQKALGEAAGNRTRAARELGVSRRTLQKKMSRLGIR